MAIPLPWPKFSKDEVQWSQAGLALSEKQKRKTGETLMCIVGWGWARTRTNTVPQHQMFMAKSREIMSEWQVLLWPCALRLYSGCQRGQGRHGKQQREERILGDPLLPPHSPCLEAYSELSWQTKISLFLYNTCFVFAFFFPPFRVEEAKWIYAHSNTD